jgi:hypothetical protein
VEADDAAARAEEGRVAFEAERASFEAEARAEDEATAVARRRLKEAAASRREKKLQERLQLEEEIAGEACLVRYT